MRVAILGYGSRGDIQPALVVADALKRRGHEVRLTVNVNSADWAKRSGVEVLPMYPDVEGFLKSPGGKQLLARGKTSTLFRELAALEERHNDDLTRICREACRGADLVCSTIVTVFRGTSIAEALEVPHVCLATLPIFRTASFGSYLLPIRDYRAGWLNRLSWDLYISAYWLGQRRVFNATRRALELPEWKRRPRLEEGAFIHMYSKHVLPIPDDVPRSHWQGGYATVSPDLRERLGEGALPHGLDEWLAAGPPPVFFGFGSMPVLDPASMLRDVIRLCEKHSIRALVGAGWTEYAQESLPETVFIAPAFDHDRVLPRCRAAVHHGGAGTTNASLRAGLPTLVCSILSDQPLWGYRVAQLGAGTTFPFQKLEPRRLSAALDVLLRPEVAERARRIGQALTAENGTEQIADLVERFARSRGNSVGTREPEV
jgi:sterol 3beta-glucosyltransferase